MSFRDIKLLYMREMRSALRERSIVINSIVVPILLYPTIIWLVFSVQTLVGGLQEQMPLRVTVGALPPAWTAFRSQLERDSRMALTSITPAESAVARDELDAALQVDASPGGGWDTRVLYTSARTRSHVAADRLKEHLRAWRDTQMERTARSAGLSPAEFQICWVDTRNMTPDRQLGSFLLSIVLPVSTILFLGFGALYPAVDTTAGERERSTWETMLVTAASRTDIIVAKYLYVVTLATLSGLLNLTVVLLCLKALLGPAPGVTIEMSATALLVVIPGTVLLALFVSAGLMLMASFARTFQQGQSLVSPFFLLVAMPGIITADPGTTFSLPMACVPVVNMALVFREAIAGRFPVLHIAISLGVLALCVVAALSLAARVVGREDLLVGESVMRPWRWWRRPRTTPEKGASQ